jgi:hypothetical protein
MSWVGVSELLVLPNGECFSLGKERSTKRGGRVHLPRTSPAAAPSLGKCVGPIHHQPLPCNQRLPDL